MNDRTRWDEPRQERGGDDNRRDWQQSQQDRDRDGSRQQGSWHDDDDLRRQGCYRGNEWRGQRDWGSPSFGYSGTQGQPQQREWRSSSQDHGMGSGAGRYGYSEFDPGEFDRGEPGHAERAWGGSSDRYGSRPTRSGFLHGGEMGPRDEMGRRDERGETAGMRQDLSSRDGGGRRGQDWYPRDDGRAGSQSFAAGYDMSSEANYDQWGGPERRQDYRGPHYGGWGPSDYTRSDERIREDVNDRLTDDPRLDARRISVSVDKGEVTLSGTVGSREAKRRAEDCIDRVSGVKHVQNNLRVEQRWREGAES